MTHTHQRSSLVSFLIGTDANGLWCGISSSSPSLSSARASSRHSLNSSPYDRSSVSAWAVSGAWPRRPRSRTSPLRRAASPAECCSRATPSGTSSPPSSTCSLSPRCRPAGDRYSGLRLACRRSPPSSGFYSPTARSSFARRRPGQGQRRRARLASSCTRRRRC